MPNALTELASKLGKLLLERKFKLALAESCTGGWIAQCVTDIPGSSQWFDRGFVTYSNEAKVEMLGVNEQTLQTYGAVSMETAKEMATGALLRSRADIALAVTGIAGPDGGTPDKPVGLVYLSWQIRGQECRATEQRLTGSRLDIRFQSVKRGLENLINAV